MAFAPVSSARILSSSSSVFSHAYWENRGFSASVLSGIAWPHCTCESRRPEFCILNAPVKAMKRAYFEQDGFFLSPDSLLLL